MRGCPRKQARVCVKRQGGQQKPDDNCKYLDKAGGKGAHDGHLLGVGRGVLQGVVLEGGPLNHGNLFRFTQKPPRTFDGFSTP